MDYENSFSRKPLYGEVEDASVVSQPTIAPSPIDPHTMSWGDLMKHASSAGGGNTGTVQSGGIGKYRSAISSFI